MEFSVVIPTFNRSGVLAKTLDGLARQKDRSPRGERFDYEVIVVDDGSTDDTERIVHDKSRSHAVGITYLHQRNRKQGAARNLGAAGAVGRYLVFLGDDTVPRDDFLREHREAHLRENDEKVVVIGYTPWAPEYRRTRFMEYVGEEGWQFGFSLIEDPNNVPFNFFYTSNLSIRRDFFHSSGGFDEDFRQYGWEDVELSLRLNEQGMRLVYHNEAVAFHHHPTSIRSFTARQRRVGQSAWLLYAKHPGLAEFLNVQKVPVYTRGQHLRMWILTGLCRLTERMRWPDFSSYYPGLMSYYYNLGIRDARDD